MEGNGDNNSGRFRIIEDKQSDLWVLLQRNWTWIRFMFGAIMLGWVANAYLARQTGRLDMVEYKVSQMHEQLTEIARYMGARVVEEKKQ